MHGYIDSFPVPLHLPPSILKTSSKGKGKAVEENVYNVVENWTKAEKDSVARKVEMASSCESNFAHSLHCWLTIMVVGYSTVLLTISLPSTYNPSLIAFPTPLFPTLDPRTAPTGTQGCVLQLWRIEIHTYDDEAVKGASAKGYYGFVNRIPNPFEPNSDYSFPRLIPQHLYTAPQRLYSPVFLLPSLLFLIVPFLSLHLHHSHHLSSLSILLSLLDYHFHSNEVQLIQLKDQDYNLKLFIEE